MARRLHRRLRPPAGHRGGVVAGRSWTLHPTKGWRSVAVRQQRTEYDLRERGINPLAIFMGLVGLRRGRS